jgi:aldose 1-epimerase
MLTMPQTPALTTASVPASGTDVTLRHGAYEAHIASVGASLRALTFDGRDLVVPFAADEVRRLPRCHSLALAESRRRRRVFLRRAQLRTRAQ